MQIPNAAEFNRTFTHHREHFNNVRLHYVTGGEIIERCGHWIADERPEYLTEKLLAFFAEVK